MKIYRKRFIPDEIVDIEITKENKKYNEAKVIKYVKKSDKRIDSKCPYYELCGGCDLEHLSYYDGVEFKRNKLSVKLSLSIF